MRRHRVRVERALDSAMGNLAVALVTHATVSCVEGSR